jgi:hypothetical protein
VIGNTVFDVAGAQPTENFRPSKPKPLQRLASLRCNNSKIYLAERVTFYLAVMTSLHSCRIDVNRPLSVYKDENVLPNQGPGRMRNLKENNPSWRTLGTQAERGKENKMTPAKWTSHKVFSVKPFNVVHVRFVKRITVD